MGETSWVIEDAPPEEVAPASLVGRRLVGVTGSFHRTEGNSWAWLLHVWLEFEHAFQVQCHTLSGVRLLVQEPHDSYEMSELGSTVTVERGVPFAVARLVPSNVEAVQVVAERDTGADAGFVLSTSAGQVGIADIGDDLVIWDVDQEWWPPGLVHPGAAG